MISRRSLLSSMGFVASLSWLPKLSGVMSQEKPLVPDSFPQTIPKLASEIVGASHFDLDKVTALLLENPSLAKASWDWGFGDWETTIGAASHTGRRDIIELLLAHGASPTIFSFAAMDQVDVVRSICQTNSNIQKTRGPHGITLLKHAVASKADRVIEYLKELGQADVPQPDNPLSAEAMSVYFGSYDFGKGASDVLEVGKGGTVPRLGIRRTGWSYRFMACLGQHTFNLYGSPQVEITFEVIENQAASVRVKNSGIDVVAQRI